MYDFDGVAVERDLRIVHTENRFEVGVVSDGVLLSGLSLYVSQVREFLSPVGGLRGRSDELEMLAGFCRGGKSYLWMRAEPWAGKSALLSWFALYPPPDVTVISFFVTDRLADQNDHAAFTAAVFDQLAVLLPDQRALIAAATINRDGLRNELLTGAAEREATAGRRLVLVVDGLDEDTGRPPIVSLLPARPHANLRVIIASRHGPSLPIPHRHPLANCPSYVLAPSPFAADIRAHAVAELDALLHGPEKYRDLLALITAANGLTTAELGELTGMAPFEVDGLLGGVSGRSFRATSASSALDRAAGPVYALAHETLQRTAEQRLGSRRLDSCLEQLHAWADRYRDLGWPVKTPDFLLRRYFPILDKHSDFPRMAALALDAARHERMYAYFGGDLTALTEIRTVQSSICDQSAPDLLTTARIARHRDHLHRRNTNIPESLLTAHALLGHYDRAEALARGTADPWQQAERLAKIAKIVAGTDIVRAHRLIGRAETLVRSIPDPMLKGLALGHMIEVVASTDAERAETLACAIPEPVHRASVLVDVAETVARADSAHAGRLIDHAEALAHTFPELQRASVLAEVAAAVERADPDRAERLFSHAVSLTHTISDPMDKVHVLVLVASGMARTDPHRADGLIDRAEILTREITEPPWRALALSAVVQAVECTDLDRAEILIREIPDSDYQDGALASLVATMASTDLGRAETLARGISAPWRQARVFSSLIREAARTDLDRAKTLAREVSAPDQQASALAYLADTVASTDPDHADRLIDHAETLTRTISEPQQEAAALARVAAAVARAHPDRANQLIDHAETLTRTISEPQQEVFDLAYLAAAVARTDPDRANQLIDHAETLTRTVPEPQRDAFTLARLSEVIASTDLDRAAASARKIPDPEHQGSALSTISGTVARTDPHHAETLARGISDPEWQARAFCRVVEAVACIDPDHAETLANEIAIPGQQAYALVDVAAAVAHTDPDRAGQLIDKATILAHEIPDWTYPTHAAIAAATIDLDRAETLAREVPGPHQQVYVLVDVAAAVAHTDPGRAGQLIDYAETLTREVPELNQQAYALICVAAAVARTDPDRTDRLTDEAETLAREIPDSRGKSSVLAHLAEAMVFRHPDRADALARSISDPWPQAETLSKMATAVAGIDADRAEALALEIAIPGQQAAALTGVADAVVKAARYSAARGSTGAGSGSLTNAPAGSFAEPADRRRKRLLARAWSVAAWTIPLSVLAEAETSVLHELASDLLGAEQ